MCDESGEPSKENLDAPNTSEQTGRYNLKVRQGGDANRHRQTSLLADKPNGWRLDPRGQ
jgi:hypothetical protein